MSEDVRLVRQFASEPAEVLAAFTDADRWAEWMWPPHLQTSVTTDPREGGRFAVRSEVADLGFSGTYRAVRAPGADRPGYLDMTWQWDGDGHATRVVVQVDSADRAAGCTLTVTHTENRDADETARHVQGWNDCLDRLAEYLVSS